MADFHEDQAAGLRRMFVRDPARMVTFAGGAANCGNSTVLLATAQALAEAGERVTVIDEHQGSGSVCARFGLTTRFDLLQAINRDAGLAHVRRLATGAITVVTAARLAAQGDGLTRMQTQALGELVDEIRNGSDWVLVDASASRAGVSPLARLAEQWVVSSSASPAALTGAYTLIKRAASLVGEAATGVVARRARNGLDGTRIYAQLADVSRAHLDHVPEWLGELPAPPQWGQPACASPERELDADSRATGERVAKWLAQFRPQRQLRGGMAGQVPMSSMAPGLQMV